MAFLDVLKIMKFMLPFLLRLLSRKLLGYPQVYLNRRFYQTGQHPRNIVIVGGSWGGMFLAKSLTGLVPSGWRIVLVEKNSHFHLLFPFPRLSVVPGHERKGFVPYNEILFSGRNGIPRGIYERIQDTVVDVGPASLSLASGAVVPYDFLALATGTSSPAPARLRATAKRGGCAELRGLQRAIAEAGRIAVVGAGAVGVELATDIKSYYPDKSVTLVHARERTLQAHGPRLHERVMEALLGLGIRTRLGQRPEMVPRAGADVEPKGPRPADSGTLRFPDGSSETFDLVLPCTGQTPNTALVRNAFPDSISHATGRILVHPTLQIASRGNESGVRFALGDVAETGAPKMGRAAGFQAEIVASNIAAMVRGRQASSVYTPHAAVEGAVLLTLGMTEAVLYAADGTGDDVIMTTKKSAVDGQATGLWALLGVKFDEALAAADA